MNPLPNLISTALIILQVVVFNYCITYGLDTNLATLIGLITFNVMSFLFWVGIQLLSKIGVKSDLVLSIIQAVEETSMPDTRGSAKLDYAVQILDVELSKLKIPIYIRPFLKPFLRWLISQMAKPAKRLLYSTPPAKIENKNSN